MGNKGGQWKVKEGSGNWTTERSSNGGEDTETRPRLSQMFNYLNLVMPLVCVLVESVKLRR